MKKLISVLIGVLGVTLSVGVATSGELEEQLKKLLDRRKPTQQAPAQEAGPANAAPTQEKEFKILPIGNVPLEDEVRLGRQIAGNLLGAAPLVKDDKLQQYVNRVGRWVAAQSDRPDLKWTFGVIESNDINAFAAPGGYVFITRGLYLRLKDEAELAFQQAEAQTTVDRERAIAEYQRAIKLRPNYVDAYIGLARAYAERGDVENTFKAVQSAKRLKPGHAEVSVIEGRMLKDSGEEDKAIVVFKRSIAEGKGFQPEAYTGLGLLYKDRAENAGGSGEYDKETANYNEAAKNLSVAVKQLGGAPDAIIVYQLLGLIYERQRKFKEAITLYEKFLEIFPNAAESDAVRSFIIQIRKQMADQK